MHIWLTSGSYDVLLFNLDPIDIFPSYTALLKKKSFPPFTQAVCKRFAYGLTVSSGDTVKLGIWPFLVLPGFCIDPDV